MIETGLGVGGGDTIGGSVDEAVVLSAAQSQDLETDLSPQGNVVGDDKISLPDPYTPA